MADSDGIACLSPDSTSSGTHVAFRFQPGFHFGPRPAVYHDSLERGAPGGAGRFSPGHRSSGKTLPHLLVSALRVRAKAGKQPGRCPGFDAKLLFPSAGEELFRKGRSRPRQVPYLPAEIDEKLPGQRMETGGPFETGRWCGVSFH